MSKQIDNLIINSPYEEPQTHWVYQSETQEFVQREGRRPAGYWRATPQSRGDVADPGEFTEIELVNKIRPRIQKWRENRWPNVTGTTRKLLEHWYDNEQREYPFFWCQLEAVETAIFLTEGPPDELVGLDIPQESDWQRQCLKLATGTGKTVVMSMLIAWQALNKIANPQDARFSKNILIIAPGLTVRDRLQVLHPYREDNFYQSFGIVPPSLWQELLQAKIKVENWHSLAPENENYGPKVVKKGPESPEAFVKRTLKEFGNAQNILVINDEAHHCHRPSEDEVKDEKEKATVWIEAIDRIHQARGVLTTYDLTATPFKPTGRNNRGEELFKWIVSDFGLNDSIESGLVKTPKVAVRDDSALDKDLRSKLFHLYPHVKDDLNRRVDEKEPLPDLLHNAINILGADWASEKKTWEETGRVTPPVLITICNNTNTAARVEYTMKQGYSSIPEFSQKDKVLRIDQEALDKAETGDEDTPKSKKDAGEEIREKVNTVGKEGKPGEQIQVVIGVNMLSEGWDARTVTHILGVRAFTSQLLCEQVIGRGLRRVSYDINEETGKFEPEYVTVFGIPFTYLPVEGNGGTKGPEKPKTKVGPVPERKHLAIRWPHVLRVERKIDYFLEIDWKKVSTLELSPEDAPTLVETAPVIDGKPDVTKLSPLKLESLADADRLQKIKLQIAARLRDQFADNWEGDAGSQIGQLVNLVDEFLESKKVKIKVPKYEHADLLKRIVIALNVNKIASHLGNAIRTSSSSEPVAVFDTVRPVRSTGSAMTWYTSKPTTLVEKSHISHFVSDSGWEGTLAYELERNRIPGLVSWVKNDRLGFEIFYFWKGRVHAYRPDFIIRFENDRFLIVEVKGKQREQDKAKWDAAKEWVEAVNKNGNFGTWEFKVLKKPKDIFDVVK